MHREARRSTRKRSNQVRGCRSRKSDFDILKKFGLRLRVYNVKICRCINAIPEDFRVFVTDCARMSVNNS